MSIFGDVAHGIGTAASDVGGIFQNAANDAINFATQGVPAIADLVGSNVAAPFAAGYGVTGLPGSSGAMHFAEAVPQADLNAFKGIANYYGSKYGPILGDVAHGDLGGAAVQFGKDFYSHPGYTLLDVLGVLSGGEGAIGDIGAALARGAAADTLRGAVAGAGTELGAAALRHAIPFYGGKLSDSLTGTALSDARQAAYQDAIANQPNWLQHFTNQGFEPGMPLYRAPKTFQIGDHTIEIPRRPYSPKPIERTLQRGLGGLTEQMLAHVPEGTKYIGVVDRAARGEAKLARTAAKDAQDAAKIANEQAGAGGVTDTVGKMKAPERALVGALAYIGGSGQSIIDHFRQAVADGGGTAAEHNLSVLEKLPEELRGPLASQPESIQEAVQRAREYQRNVDPSAKQSLGLSDAGMASRVKAQADTVLGGSRYDPNLVRATPELAAARSAYEQAKAELSRVRSEMPRYGTVRSAESAGARFGRQVHRVATEPTPLADAQKAVEDAMAQYRDVQKRMPSTETVRRGFTQGRLHGRAELRGETAPELRPLKKGIPIPSPEDLRAAEAERPTPFEFTDAAKQALAPYEWGLRNPDGTFVKRMFRTRGDAEMFAKRIQAMRVRGGVISAKDAEGKIVRGVENVPGFPTDGMSATKARAWESMLRAESKMYKMRTRYDATPADLYRARTVLNQARADLRLAKGRHAALIQQFKAKSRMYQLRTGYAETPANLLRARSAVQDARLAFVRARKAATGGYTEPRPYEADPGAVYFHHVPLKRMVDEGGGQYTSGRSLGGPTAHESHMTLLRTGNVNLDPLAQIPLNERVFADKHFLRTLFGPNKALGETGAPGVVEGWMYHYGSDGPFWKAGDRITGPRAALMVAQEGAGLKRLVNLGLLERGMARAGSLIGIEGAAAPDFSGLVASDAAVSQYARNITDAAAGILDPAAKQAAMEAVPLPAELAAQGARKSDFVVMSRPAADAWNRMAGGGPRPDAALRAYDKILSAWKVGILGLRPAWQVHVTLSHVAQFSMLADRDIGAIFSVGSPDSELRKLMERLQPGVRIGFQRLETDPADAAVRTATGIKMAGRASRVSARFRRALNVAFKINDRIQTRIRAAGYLAESRHIGRQVGLDVAHMTPEDLIQAIADNPAWARETLHGFNDFMGDYSHFSVFEQSVMRRIFPFYSWLRVATRLAYALPARSPLKAEALAIAGRGAQIAVDPNNVQGNLPIYDRGYMPILGTHAALGISAANPFSDVARMLAGVEQGPSGLAQTLYSGSASPFAQIAASEITGTNPMTGQPYYAPPGYGGTVTSSRGATMQIDPTTGLPEYTGSPSPGLLSQIASQVPLESTVRGLLAGSGHPYATTSDLALLQSALGIGAPPAQSAFEPPSRAPGVLGSIPYATTGSSFLGLPYKSYNPANEQAVIQRLLAAYQAAGQSTTYDQQRILNEMAQAGSTP